MQGDILKSRINSLSPWTQIGQVTSFSSASLQVAVPRATLGATFWVDVLGGTSIPAQVISARRGEVVLSPYGDVSGVFVGARVRGGEGEWNIKIPINPIGQVLNFEGQPLKGSNPAGATARSEALVSIPMFREPPSPLSRPPLNTLVTTGVRSLDLLCPLARGQRVGVFAEAGVGKSTLLGMITRWANADAIVVALIGERGREVNEFIHDAIGEEGMKRSVVVVSTSDEPATCRGIALNTATAVAEYLRDQGKHVLLVCDSLTRMARAIREVAVRNGDMPIQRGYPSAVFAALPKLLERAGNSDRGSITALYTVLTESSEELERDALGEEIKSILDGHIVLSRAVAQSGLLPAIHASRSLSRVAERLMTKEHELAAAAIRRIFFRLERDRELSMLGGVVDDELKFAISSERPLIEFLSQTPFLASKLREDISAVLERFSKSAQ